MAVLFNCMKLFIDLGCTYLDHAGTTMYSQSQLSACVGELAGNCFGNPHSRSQSGRLTSDLVSQARAEVLRFFNADPQTYSLIFTSGATQSLKIVAESFQYSEGNQSGSLAYMTESHTSVVGMRQFALKR